MVSQKKRRGKKPSYKGVLKKPIVCDPLSSAEEQSNVIRVEWMKKMSALYDHYHIEPSLTAGYSLALALAIDNVPGFEVVAATKKLKPAQYTGSGLEGVILYARVKKYMKKKRCNVVAAIQAISKSEGSNPKSLRIRYYEAIRPSPKGNNILNAFKAIAKNHGMTDEQFDERIIDSIPQLICVWFDEKNQS